MKKAITAYLLIFLLPALFSRTQAQDITPPGRPYIIYVTVDTANNDTHIYWTESPSSDVEKYYLYYEIRTINGYEGVKFDSVQSGIAQFTHVNSGAGAGSILYSVTAVDSSGNESIRKPGLHSTVYTTLEYDSCQSRMKVTWNRYQGWGNNVSGYRILRSINNAPFSIVTGVNPTDSFYFDNGITENTLYRYLIQAVKNDGLESMSNIAVKYTYMPPSPLDLSIDYATVPFENTVDIALSFTPNGEVDDFTLLRSSNPVSDFQKIQSVYDVTSAGYIFSDDNVITTSDHFYYKIGSLNGCGAIIGTSNIAVNILLSGDTLGRTVRLFWNKYEDWDDGVMEYNVYRKESDGSYILLGTTSPSTTNFTDQMIGVAGHHLSGQLTYYIEAVRNSGADLSRSNEFIIRVSTTIVQIPNAFTPNSDGRNDNFTPVFDFRPSEFLLIIYNRIGVPVFTTEDPETGWDGSVNGNNMAQEGVYVYHIQYKSFNGTRAEKTGHVTVFYP